jgi:hypothetical protein
MPVEQRRERAEYYFNEILEGQEEWYSKGAGSKKRWHLGLALSVIVLGAAISCLQTLHYPWVPIVTALIGASITILRAVDTLIRPGETWQAYRKASESMRREYRLYLNNADVYGEAADEDAAYRLLVSRVENAVAEEQQLFWQFHDKAGQATKAAQEPRRAES